MLGIGLLPLLPFCPWGTSSGDAPGWGGAGAEPWFGMALLPVAVILTGEGEVVVLLDIMKNR